MKKKVLIISIITIIVISVVSIFVFYKVQHDKQTSKVSTLNDTITKEEPQETKDEITKENITNEERAENTEENKENTKDENNQETKEENIKNTQDKTTQNTKDNNKTETQKTNSGEVTQSTVKQPQTTTTINDNSNNQNKKEETKVEEPKKETVKIDLSKYDRYETLGSGYKAYKKSDSEMTKLRGLIDTCINEMGYTNVKVVPNNTKPSNAQAFTANKVNVENKVYNSEDFTIYYYAEAEYHITEEGNESIFQYRSYIKVQ